MSTKTGREAEEFVAEQLMAKGFSILHKNWRTRFCEIDVIAESKRYIYFIEVKYRRKLTTDHDTNFISNQKINQLRLAAEFFLQANKITKQPIIAVVAVTGESPNLVIKQFYEFYN